MKTRNRADHAGTRFGRLVAIRYDGEQRWLCQCDCGRTHRTRASTLVAGKCLSCGCLPRQGIAKPRRSEEVSNRLSRYLNKTDSCWLWTGPRNSSGYGTLRVAGKSKLAHRLMYEMAFGNPPGDLLVCHHCDTPLCVRPDHLFLGTQADNIEDMVRKGRGRNSAGAKNPSAIITKDDAQTVLALAQNGLAQADIVRNTGLNQSAVSRIMRGTHWTVRTEEPRP